MVNLFDVQYAIIFPLQHSKWKVTTHLNKRKYIENVAISVNQFPIISHQKGRKETNPGHSLWECNRMFGICNCLYWTRNCFCHICKWVHILAVNLAIKWLQLIVLIYLAFVRNQFLWWLGLIYIASKKVLFCVN